MQLFLVIISDKLQNNLIIFNFAHSVFSQRERQRWYGKYFYV